MIGEAFRMRRKRRGIRIETVARKLKVSDRFVSIFEMDGLRYTMTDSLDKLIALNKQWTCEDAYGIKCYE